MKKNFLLTVCFAATSVLGVNAQNGVGTIALHHNGKVTIFDGNKSQDAMNASVKGDTLYLSEGVFAGFDVTHGIVVLGSGENTTVTSDINITGKTENAVFSGLNLLHQFNVKDSLIGLRMTQCQIDYFVVQNDKFLDNSAISMSYLKGGLRLTPSSVHGLEVTNSKIKHIYGGGLFSSSATFFNCNVDYNNDDYNSSIYGEPNYGQSHNTFYNSIVGSPTGATCINCVYDYSNSNATLTNSWKDSWEGWSDNSLNMDSPYTDEELMSKGYIGTDGTVIGITGGASPYTLELFVPHVIDHQLEVDNVNKILKATLKMSGEGTKND